MTRYGRVLATCFVGDENLSDRIVREGWALDFRRHPLPSCPHLHRQAAGGQPARPIPKQLPKVRPNGGGDAQPL